MIEERVFPISDPVAYFDVETQTPEFELEQKIEELEKELYQMKMHLRLIILELSIIKKHILGDGVLIPLCPNGSITPPDR
jgi:hypothetical protein